MPTEGRRTETAKRKKLEKLLSRETEKKTDFFKDAKRSRQKWRRLFLPKLSF